MTFASLRSVVDHFLTDACTITAAAPVVFDAATGSYDDDHGADLYTGACWVRPYRIGDIVAVVDEPIAAARYLVTLPWDAPDIPVGACVTVTTTDDTHLAGAALRVIAVEGGSGAVSRRLVVDDTAPVEEGTGS